MLDGGRERFFLKLNVVRWFEAIRVSLVEVREPKLRASVLLTGLARFLLPSVPALYVFGGRGKRLATKMLTRHRRKRGSLQFLSCPRGTSPPRCNLGTDFSILIHPC